MQSSTQGQTALQKVGNTLSAVFTPKKDWKTFDGNIITKANIDSYIPKLGKAEASELLMQFQQKQNDVNAGLATWDYYFKDYTDGQKWQTAFIQNTDLQKASTQDLMKANEDARKAVLAHNQAIKDQTISARAGKAALQALSAAANMAIMFIAIKGIEKLVSWLDSLHTSLEEQREISDNLQSELDSIQSEISDVNSELETTASRIDELNAKDSLSFLEKDELERLKEGNEELSKRNKLLKEEGQKKRDELADSVKAEFDKEYGGSAYEKIWSQDELDSLNQDKERYYKLFDMYFNTGLTESEMKEMFELKAKIDQKDQPAFSSFEEHIDETISAYNLLLQKKRENSELTEDEEKILEQYRTELRNTVLDLDDYIERYDKSDDTSRSWNDTRNKIYNSLFPADYQTEMFNEVFDSLSKNVQTELKNMAKNGTLSAAALTAEILRAFSDAGFTTDEVIDQLYASFSVSPDRRKSGMAFQTLLNSSEYANTRESLLSLAKSGELTPETLSSTEEYAKLLKDTGASAEEAAGHILNMLSAQEKLSAASTGIKRLESSYSEFNELGFVTASTLEALPDVFKELEGYDLFAETAGDPTKSAEEIQKAFDDIAAQYLLSQHSLSGLLNASEREIQSYIANLKQMGFTNAEEIVNQTLSAADSEAPLISEAEEEYYNMYLDHLQGKSEMDEGYLSDTTSKNGQLADALGSAYQSDYTNWCDLLKQKAEAYDYFLTTIGGTYDESKSISENMKENGVSTKPQNVVAAYSALFEHRKKQKEAEEARENVSLSYILTGTNIDLPTYRPTTSNSSYGAEAAEKTAQTFDWIETLLSRLEKKITALGKTVSAVWKKWSDRNRAVSEEMSAVIEQTAAQQKAYEAYMAKADAVGLPEAYAELVKSGAIEISMITDDELSNQIDEYQKWYEKALDCKDAIDDLEESLSDLYSQAFDNVSSEFDNLLQEIEFKKSMLDEQISRTEERGWLVSIAYYQALAETEQANLNRLSEEKAALLTAFHNAVESGAIAEFSEEWYRMQGEINDVTLAIEEANTAMISYGNSIRDIEWEVFDLLQEKISRITAESDFLSSLLSNDTLYDDNGRITNEGMSVMGLHGLNYNLYMEQSKKYAEEIAKIDKQLAEDPYNQELADRRQELLELQQEMILAAEDEKQAIADMVKDGIDLELNALKELIDTYTNALDAQKDLYDYQKKVADQTKEIASLEKQITAYENDSSEEAKTKLQQLKVSLEDARKNLEETRYERYISDQKQMLDELYNEYELALNGRLDEIDALMSEMIAEINRNAGVISDTLSAKAEAVGISLSENMYRIWNTGTETTCNVLTMYGTQIENGISSAATTVNNTLNAINSGIADMIAHLDRLAENTISALSGKPSDGGSFSGGASSGSPDSSSVSGSGESASSGAWGSWFLPKEDHYPKDKLNIETSIVDRLKYHNFDSSFSACLSYYSAMGGSGTYTGSAEQNAWMISQMKAHGYKNGAYRISRSELAWTQENGKAEAIIRPYDGAILTPLAKGDSVLNHAATENLFHFANRPADFIHSHLHTDTAIPVRTGAANQTCCNNIDFTVSLPNVMNYSDFKYAMQHDKNFEKMVQAMTVGMVSGGSSLKKYRC